MNITLIGWLHIIFYHPVTHILLLPIVILKLDGQVVTINLWVAHSQNVWPFLYLAQWANDIELSSLLSYSASRSSMNIWQLRPALWIWCTVAYNIPLDTDGQKIFLTIRSVNSTTTFGLSCIHLAWKKCKHCYRDIDNATCNNVFWIYVWHLK